MSKFGDIAKNVGFGIMTAAVILGTAYAESQNIQNGVKPVDYSDAMDALMDSEIEAYWKDRLSKKILKDQTETYYKTVISIIKGNDEPFWIEQMINNLA